MGKDNKISVVMPAAWASAIINDDRSGLEDDEAKEFRAWEIDNTDEFVDVGEPYVGAYAGRMRLVAEYWTVG